MHAGYTVAKIKIKNKFEECNLSCQRMYPMKLQAKSSVECSQKFMHKNKSKIHVDFRIYVHVGPLELKTID